MHDSRMSLAIECKLGCKNKTTRLKKLVVSCNVIHGGQGVECTKL